MKYVLLFPPLIYWIDESLFSNCSPLERFSTHRRLGPAPRMSESLLGCCPQTCIFNKFPDDTEVIGLRSTELEQHLMLVPRPRKLGNIFIFHVNLGPWVSRSEGARLCHAGRSGSFIGLEGGPHLAPGGHRSLVTAPLRGKARAAARPVSQRTSFLPGCLLPAAPRAGCGTESTQSRRLCPCVTGRWANGSPGGWHFFGPGRWGAGTSCVSGRQVISLAGLCARAVGASQASFRDRVGKDREARTLLRAFE